MTTIPDIKLIRTDTTLDLSQKAEKNTATRSALERRSPTHIYICALVASAPVALAPARAIGTRLRPHGAPDHATHGRSTPAWPAPAARASQTAAAPAPPLPHRLRAPQRLELLDIPQLQQLRASQGAASGDGRADRLHNNGRMAGYLLHAACRRAVLLATSAADRRLPGQRGES